MTSRVRMSSQQYFFVAAGGKDEIPAVIKPTQDLPPPYSASGQQQISSADFQVNNDLLFKDQLKLCFFRFE